MEAYPVILALDYGTKRVGVAISRGSLAEPLTILPNDPALFTQIQHLIDANRVERVVVGLSENVMADLTQEFISQLKKKVTIPIQVTDETLSSYTVASQLKESGAKLKQRQQPIDDRAAAVFLQEYLDTFSR